MQVKQSPVYLLCLKKTSGHGNNTLEPGKAFNARMKKAGMNMQECYNARMRNARRKVLKGPDAE
jgi:hypothetical protein